MVKKIILLLVLILVTASLIGCQTVQGIGRDITWTGEAGAEVVDGAFPTD